MIPEVGSLWQRRRKDILPLARPPHLYRVVKVTTERATTCIHIVREPADSDDVTPYSPVVMPYDPDRRTPGFRLSFEPAPGVDARL